MKIEIDQSGKLEYTSKPTVIGFSNDHTKSIIISAREKQKLQKLFRAQGKPKMYIYNSFAVLVFLLLRKEKNIEEIIIDKEYAGHEPVIKNLLLSLLTKFDKKAIIFENIGKKSNAHTIAWSAYSINRADIRVTADDIEKYIE